MRPYNPAFSGLGSSDFARRYFRNLRRIAPLLDFFSLSYLDGSLHSVWLYYPILFRYVMTESLPSGYPIRLSGNHGMCASPPGFSQLTTAFFASQLPGIRHKPLSLDHIIFFAFRIAPHRFRIRSSSLGFLPSAPRHTSSFLPSLHCQCALASNPQAFRQIKTLLK